MYLNFSAHFILFFQTSGNRNCLEKSPPPCEDDKNIRALNYFFQVMQTEIDKKEESPVEESSVVESQSAPETSNIEVNEEEPPHEKVKIKNLNGICKSSVEI